tara:strand:+ start:25 stop:396 length:372 start_codon:yes stop_codon:yes gene_type:complete
MSNWKRKKNYNGKNKNYSIVNKLRQDKKTSEEFEIMLGGLTMEEVIALKLELATRTLSNRLYGFPIWKSLPDIAKEAALKYAVSATRTTKEAMRLLGLKESAFHVLMKKYQVEDYFENLSDKP